MARKKWSESDLEVLKEKLIAGASISELAEFFGRTKVAISHKLAKEELKTIRIDNGHFSHKYKKEWTEDQDSLLKDKLVLGETVDAIAKLLDRKIGSVYARIKKLGLSIIKDPNVSYNLGKGHGWTLGELELLKQHAKYPFDIDKVSKLLSRPKSSIYGKIDKLELTIHDTNSTLEQICDRIINNMYDRKSLTTCCAIEGITRDKFDRCVARTIDLKDKLALYTQWQDNNFTCYTCGEIYSKSCLSLEENEFQRTICKLCKEKNKPGEKHYTYINSLKGRLARLASRSRRVSKNCDFDADYLQKLYNNQNGRCYYSGLEMKYAGVHSRDFYIISLDQKVPGQGYIKSNIALCCWGINRVKSDHTPEEFIKLCKIIVDYKQHKEYSYDDCGV